MVHMNKLLLAFIALSFCLLGQESPKSPQSPPDSVVAAYFKAEGAVTAARSEHESLMENIKKAVADSIIKQVNATIQVLISRSQLEQSCGELQLDLEALKAREIKCIEKLKEPAK